MHQYDRLRLAMFSGKGGVGKTTLACGFARSWAHRFPQQSTLLLSTDPAHSLGDVLQMTVSDDPQALPDLPQLQVRSLDADRLLQTFKANYGDVLEQLVERGSFVQTEDLSPVWNLSWPGLDELMGILEIQRLLQAQTVDRIVVDMAPSGHTLNLFGLMDFLDEFLAALDLFQEKHRVISQTFTGRYTADAADDFLTTMKADLANGRQLLQDQAQTACLVVAIAEPMSLLETHRFLTALETLAIPFGGLFINHLLPNLSTSPSLLDRLAEQHQLLKDFLTLAAPQPVWTVPEQPQEPIGAIGLDALMAEVSPAQTAMPIVEQPVIQLPSKLLPSLSDFVAEDRRLILVGGKGGVGKTTVAAAIAWNMAQQHPDRAIQVISIDPAHSLGDAFGQTLGHEPIPIAANLTGQEVDAEQVLDQFRADYLWELAEMMSGESGDDAASLKIAYGPVAWRKIVAQALPGIDEMLSLITVMELLESHQQDLIILDTAPTGHLLRFLEMPTALGDWLAWIFKLWIKYQDVVGRVELMGRLRTLRQRVMQAQKKLKDPQHTEFIGVVQAQSAILAEAQRLTESLEQLGIAQRYIVHNRYEAERNLERDRFSHQTIVRLPNLPRSVPPMVRIQMAAQLL
ncbi:ArsA family ATPase [Pantanalinema sp. GBBB05]|uniref:ArsA family ATPase n=1 Tax=Pantanalinema sp. GBBB05 TaxID=2604139 RepID=UPI001D2B110A|nr:ArsA family ATPase [Pantanalinema sp. GBBB05]